MLQFPIRGAGPAPRNMPARRIRPRAPLQVILFGDLTDIDVRSYAEAISATVNGSAAPVGYVPACERIDLQLDTIDAASDNIPSIRNSKTSFRASIVIVLITQKLAERSIAKLRAWLQDFWALAKDDTQHHRFLPLALDERAASLFSRTYDLGTVQVDQAYLYGERSVRPAAFSLRVLHEARVLLTPAGKGSNLRLFVSHAKLDGLPLARALKHQVEEIPGLAPFYDVESIPPGRAWIQELESGVKTSVIIMLRTEAYDQRHWCRQEVLWSDEYATPAVLVEARTGLAHAACGLPFDRVPTVRIPDGNLLRIVFHAIREAARFVAFMAKVEEMKLNRLLPAKVHLRVFCLAPSMAALLRACVKFRQIKNRHKKMILYPDPPLPKGLFEAAQALVTSYGAISLVTPQTIVTTRGKRK